MTNSIRFLPSRITVFVNRMNDLQQKEIEVLVNLTSHMNQSIYLLNSEILSNRMNKTENEEIEEKENLRFILFT